MPMLNIINRGIKTEEIRIGHDRPHFFFQFIEKKMHPALKYPADNLK